MSEMDQYFHEYVMYVPTCTAYDFRDMSNPAILRGDDFFGPE